MTRLAAAFVLALVAGCHSMPRPTRAPSAPVDIEKFRTVGDDAEDSETTLSAEGARRAFILQPVVSSDPLPDVRQTTTVSVGEGGLYDALQLLSQSSGFGLVVEGGPQALERYGPTTVLRASGRLPVLIERLSQALGFFYRFSEGTLHVATEGRFVIELPPSLGEDNFAGMSNMLQYLGARDVLLDRLNRSIFLRTNKRGLADIRRYLDDLRRNRSMLLYDVHVFEVELNDGLDKGIQWNKLGWGNSRTGSITKPDVTASLDASSSSGTAAYGLGATIVGPRFSLGLLMEFLQSQGSVRSVSQPRIALMSGSRGSMRVGQTTNYVAKVGSNIGNSINQTSVETQTLLTGFELTLFGEEHDGTIYTRININLSDVVKMTRFVALGTDLSLPQTSEREVRTLVRARAGDMVLLGGIAYQRDSVEVNNGLGANAKSDAVRRSELVIALRPRVVRFDQTEVAVSSVAGAASVASAAGASKIAPTP